MDIDKHTFPARLLDVLEAIAEAHFVSFDLELSGVPVKRPKETPGKPSLQARYLETKQAADKFQILQFGLTCVKEDLGSTYICRPFNFNLSPVIEERLDVDRTFSFHSGAVEFLLGVGFRMDLPFIAGVPYLSRSEAELAQQRAAARQDKSSYTDIEIKPEDVQALAFLSRVRAEIESWKETGRPNQTSLVIGPMESSDEETAPELNRFERRLVHQLVRGEYPDLVSMPNRGLIRVARLEPEREEYIKAQRSKEVQERIIRQTGFRWIVEALCGNSPNDIDVKSFALTSQGTYGFVDLDYIKSRFNRVKHLLQGKKTALFGHNLFLDLIYLYRTFIGELPDTVEEFCALIHGLFPVIVDTKYMATHNCGDINPQSSLEQIAEKLAQQQHPRVETHEDHDKYDCVAAFHEAGYDSMLTAQVAVRLSAKLDLAGSHVEGTNDKPPPSPPDDGGGVELNDLLDNLNPIAFGGATIDKPSAIDTAIDGFRNFLLTPVKALAGSSMSSSEQIAVVEANRSVDAANPNTAAAEKNAEADGTENEVEGEGFTEDKSKKKKKKKNKGKKTAPAPSAHQPGRFAHATAYDQLRETTEVSEEDAPDELLQFDAIPSANAHASDPVVADTDGVSDPWIETSTWEDMPAWCAAPKREAGTAMPEFGSNFWKVYGNKLRVFGTQEGIAMLS